MLTQALRCTSVDLPEGPLQGTGAEPCLPPGPQDACVGWPEGGRDGAVWLESWQRSGPLNLTELSFWNEDEFYLIQKAQGEKEKLEPHNTRSWALDRLDIDVAK